MAGSKKKFSILKVRHLNVVLSATDININIRLMVLTSSSKSYHPFGLKPLSDGIGCCETSLNEVI